MTVFILGSNRFSYQN